VGVGVKHEVPEAKYVGCLCVIFMDYDKGDITKHNEKSGKCSAHVTMINEYQIFV